MLDAIVVGLGAMGSAATFHLARRGARVLGLDRFRPPHVLGSSHGHTRIIRQAYFEHPLYVPLVQRAYECWGELERLSGRPLLVKTGGLMIGAPDSDVVRGALRSATAHGLAHELLSRAEMHARYPAFRLPRGHVALLEPDAGYLLPEACVEAHLAQAAAHGATLRHDEPMLSWERIAGGVRVTTVHGHHDARRLVLAAGAWMPAMLPALPLSVERQTQHWFTPGGNRSLLQGRQFPVFIWEYAPGEAWYGFPHRAEGMKMALHHQGDIVDVDRVARSAHADEAARVRALARRLIPDADGPVRESSVCLYTNTPDHHFVLDTLPEHPGVVVASPCSGHGFKFSSAIGEAVAELVLDGASRHDLSPFRLSRFAGHPS